VVEAVVAAPEAGALFEYGTNSFGTGPAHYRVKAWMRRRAPRQDALDFATAGALPGEYGGTMALLMAEVVREVREHEGAGHRERMEFCMRDVATHVCGAGIAGCVAAISKIKVTGMVQWSDAAVAEARDYAQRIALRDTLADC
jgi:hypothetical protein